MNGPKDNNIPPKKCLVIILFDPCHLVITIIVIGIFDGGFPQSVFYCPSQGTNKGRTNFQEIVHLNQF